MEAKKSILLRHRFDDLEQLRRHLHVVDGSTLLFFRDPRLTVGTASPVLVEVAFESSEQTRALRATVLARAEGQGLWLVVPNTRFARDVHVRGLSVRKGRRLGTDEMVRLKRAGGGDYMVRLLDLSIGGARIGGGIPAQLAPGTVVALTIAPPEAGRAPEITRGRIVWMEDGEAGVMEVQGDALLVGCGGGSLICFDEVQVEGKRRMSAAEFLRGYQVKSGERLGI